MQPLAQDYVVVAESPDKERHFAGSPGITRLPGGEMVASYEWFQPKPYTETLPNQTEVRVSADGGRTWELRGKTDIIWPSCFVHGGALYMIGNRRRSREVVISRSEDGGHTWTPEVEVCDRRSHGAPTAVTFQERAGLSRLRDLSARGPQRRRALLLGVVRDGGRPER